MKRENLERVEESAAPPKPRTWKIADELKRHKVRFWGQNYVITPRLVDWIHGDGKQVIYFSPLNTRPNYYVVRIDSKLSLNNYDDEPSFADEALDELYEQIEEQFGTVHEEWTSDKNNRTYSRRNSFPALNDDSGSCWGLLKMLAREVSNAR